jgi:hypothetical protein
MRWYSEKVSIEASHSSDRLARRLRSAKLHRVAVVKPALRLGDGDGNARSREQHDHSLLSLPEALRGFEPILKFCEKWRSAEPLRTVSPRSPT